MSVHDHDPELEVDRGLIEEDDDVPTFFSDDVEENWMYYRSGADPAVWEFAGEEGLVLAYDGEEVLPDNRDRPCRCLRMRWRPFVLPNAGWALLYVVDDQTNVTCAINQRLDLDRSLDPGTVLEVLDTTPTQGWTLSQQEERLTLFWVVIPVHELRGNPQLTQYLERANRRTDIENLVALIEDFASNDAIDVYSYCVSVEEADVIMESFAWSR